MEQENYSKMDLRFGDLVIRRNEIEFKGKGKGTAFRNGQSIDVPAVGTCSFRVTPGRLVSVLTEALMTIREDRRGGKQEQDMAGTDEIDEETENAEREDKPEIQPADAESEQKKGDGGRIRPYRASFRGKDGASFLIGSVARRRMVRLSVAEIREGTVIRRSSGLLPPAATLAVMDAAGKIMRNVEQHISPIQGLASLYYKEGKISFIEKEGEVTALEDWQKRELRFILTTRLIVGESFPIRFRAGRVRIIEGDGQILFGFGRLEAAMSYENLGILWVLCGGNN